jgi:hypothetical protein
MDMLGFDYFKLLDLLTIARSRKHIQKYYGTGESTIVFRDSAFADDVAKTNLTAILRQRGLENVRSP